MSTFYFGGEYLFMEGLRPGMAIDMVLEMSDPNRAMKTIIYDIIGRRIIIAQTTPPLLRSNLNERVRVSFIVKVKGIKDARLAFSATIIEFIPGYEMSSDQTVPAIALEQKTELEEIDRRMFFRIPPPLKSDITIMVRDEKAGIIDISLGGAKIIHSAGYELKPHEEIEMAIIMQGRRFNVRATVIRTEQKFNPAKAKKVQITSVQFAADDRELSHALARMIMLMERQHLAKGK